MFLLKLTTFFHQLEKNGQLLDALVVKLLDVLGALLVSVAFGGLLDVEFLVVVGALLDAVALQVVRDNDGLFEHFSSKQTSSLNSLF